MTHRGPFQPLLFCDCDSVPARNSGSRGAWQVDAVHAPVSSSGTRCLRGAVGAGGSRAVAGGEQRPFSERLPGEVRMKGTELMVAIRGKGVAGNTQPNGDLRNATFSLLALRFSGVASAFLRGTDRC